MPNTETTTQRNLEQLCINTIRFLAVDAVEKAQSGHPGTPMEAAPLAFVLWTEFLKHNPKNFRWANRDRFILSAGHASMLLYSMLYLTGYGLEIEDLKNFRQWNSKTPGHPEYGFAAGVETTTGPLGQGAATGVGMAMAEKYLAQKFNKPGLPLVDYFIYGFLSDGDMMEGVGSEAASLAGHLKLGKLKYVYLDNHITIDGNTDLAFSEDVGKRYEAYGWQVVKVADADNLDEFRNALKTARAQTERPSLVIVRTHIGFGSPNKQDTAEAHGAPLGADEVRLTKKALGWPESPDFHVPDEALQFFRREETKGPAAESQWMSLFDRYKKAHPSDAALWEQMEKSPLPAGWEKSLPTFKTGDKQATRQASGAVINALAPVIPGLIGGSADLAPSNNTIIKNAGDFSAANAGGRNLRFGVREHAMGAALNGMALSHRLIPYGGTFLIFTDYMRPAMRLASLMELGPIYIMTHDSVGLGEDGPTHQPIEHLSSLRAIPGMCVLRPADANETAQAWRVALLRRKAPTVLALSRQKLPVLEQTAKLSDPGVMRGGYLLSEAEGGKPRAILIATGSEVALALDAQKVLAAKGVAVRVVSMPSTELFDQQTREYRESVLPAAVAARVAVEAASPWGWHKYVGPKGSIVGIDRFGASAPAEVIFEKLGFTVENVVKNVMEVL